MQTQILNVTGMTCGGCVSSVTKVLQSVAGVDEVKVSLAAGLATVQYDDSQATPAQLAAAVIGAGFGVVDAQHAAGRPANGGCCG